MKIHKERPILFSGPMVRAIREGRKTQTRRIIKPQPPDQPLPNCHPRNSVKHPAPYLDAYCSKHKTAINPRGMSDLWCWWQVDDRQCLPTFRCPYGKPGDRLWVRETWQHCQNCGGVDYAADVNRPRNCRHCDASLGNWKPSIYMFRDDSRITLEIVSVRVERLKGISEEDAKAEGAEFGLWHPEQGVFSEPVDEEDEQNSCYRDGFGFIWESINGPGSWDLNPWVWVVEFKEVK